MELLRITAWQRPYLPTELEVQLDDFAHSLFHYSNFLHGKLSDS